MALALALLSAVLYGTADFLGGVASRRATAIAATAAAQGCGFVLIAIVAPLFPAVAPDARAVAWGLGAGASGAAGVGLLYYGLAVGRVSVVAPITAVCSIAIPVLVAAALGERPRPLAALGIAVAVASVALISRGDAPGTPSVTPASAGTAIGVPGTRDRSLPIGLASGVAIGAFLVCLARAGPAAGLWPLVVARGASTVLLYAAALVASVPVTLPRTALAPVVACGAIDVLANALYVFAVRGGPLGLVATLASLYPASTVLLARVVLRERLRPVQSLGLACATAAVVLITTR